MIAPAPLPDADHDQALADALRAYHAARDDGDTDRAAQLWRAYFDLVEREMRRKAA